MPTSERFFALLDQASHWLSEGEIDRAQRLADKASAIAPNDAELLALLASLEAERGRSDEAIGLWERAASAAPDWVDPVLAAAAEELEGKDDPDACLRRVAPLAHHESAEVRGEVHLLEARAHLVRDDRAAAQRALRELGATPFEDLGLTLEAAEVAIELEDDRLAEPWLRRVLASEPEHEDALHSLGLVLRERGEHEEMAASWLRVREADLSRPRPRWRLSEEEIEAFVERALEELPQAVRMHLRDVPVFVEDAPSEALIREGVDPRLLGLFSGTPMPDKTHASSPTSPDAAYVFARNLENVCGSREEMLEELRITVLHETAHFFGLEDEDLEDLGLG